ncbi:MAG: efflux RND transporter periplasmic adaptor subunit [Hylemonella sp.]|nr:efflux RND transporter periplasmic adaptor subunit [Hylemonella sp.]
MTIPTPRSLPPCFLAAGLLALAAATLPAAAAPPAAAASPAGRPALTVSVTQASAASLPVRLSANGTVAAWQEAVVGAEVGGLRVQELQVNVGDAVRKGQVLATFNAESVQADVALARANLAEAQASSGEAVANADRARALQGSGAMSGQQINQYLTQEQTARARVASAQAQLDIQLLRLKQTRLLAPDDGVIAARNATVGSVVTAGGEMFRLIRRARLEWRGEVTAGELAGIRPGLRVLLGAPGGEQLRGVVRMLAPTVDAVTRRGLVYVDLPALLTSGKPAMSAFRPGMYVRGEIELGASTALTVPSGAVVVRDGFSYVYRIGADSRVSQVKVQTGRLVGERLELLSGLRPDERVVASGAGFLSDGDLVRVVPTPAQPATK